MIVKTDRSFAALVRSEEEDVVGAAGGDGGGAGGVDDHVPLVPGQEAARQEAPCHQGG